MPISESDRTASRSRPDDPVRARRSAVGSFLGSMLEYYDFFIYGSAAALVFGRVFFPDASPTAGTLAALATFGVGYVARPIGGIVLGAVGDRLGRKRIMLFTVLLMGTSTFLIGCVPSYQSIGVAAPVLLVILRLAGGFSAGGEQAGANALTLEHSPPGRRAFYTSWTLTGTQAGFIVASLAFLAVAQLPDEALLSWGWRIPFWASAVVIAVAYFVRRKLEEPDAFRAAVPATRDRGQNPVLPVLRSHPWSVLRVLLCSFTAIGGSIFSVFALSYATGPEIGISRTTMLWVAIGANVLAMAIIPAVATLSDRWGRKPLFVVGAVGTALSTSFYLAALASTNLLLICLGAFLMTSLAYSFFIGVWPAFFAEMFPTELRYSGTAIGTQFGFALAGFAPSIGYALVQPGPNGWIPVGVFVAAALGLAAIAAATAPETFRTPLDELGRTPPSTTATSRTQAGAGSPDPRPSAHQETP